MINGKKFIEMYPVPCFEEELPTYESIHKSLERIKTIPDLLQRFAEDDDFFKSVFASGHFLWIKRRWQDQLAYIRITDTLPRYGSWFQRSYLKPLTLERWHGEEAKFIADALVDSGLATYSRRAEPAVNRVLRRGLKAYNNMRLVMRFK